MRICMGHDPLAHTYSFPNHKISFVALNSEYGCGLEGSDYDRGKLSIPAEQVLAAFQSVPNGHQIISLMHHTIADLNETASRLLIPIIEGDEVACIFLGISIIRDQQSIRARARPALCFRAEHCMKKTNL